MPTTSLPTISKLIDSTVERTRPIYWKLLGISLIGILASLPFNLYISAHPDLFLSPWVQGYHGEFFLILFGVILFSFLVQFWMTLALMSSIVEKSPIKVFQTYRKSLKLFPAFLWLYFLQMLILVPAFFCLVVPFFIVAVHLLFAVWFLVTGEARGLEALAKSRELSRGVFWKTTLSSLFPFLLLMVLSAGVNLSVESQIVTMILQTVVSLLFAPLAVTYQYELFLALKKHGTKKDPKKQMKTYKIFAIIGATLVALYLVFMLIVVNILIVSPPTEHGGKSIEKPAYERSES